MRLVRQNRTAAFDELYDRYSGRIYAFVLRMLSGNVEAARDLTQDVFLRVVEKSDIYSNEYRFSSWIFTIASNLCKNEYRRQAVRKSDPLDETRILAGQDNPERIADQRLFSEALEQALAELQPAHRTVFLLRYQQDFSVRDIARIAGCAEGTVKSRLHHIIRQLGHQLKDYEGLLK
jgi:RNA polymerase sigma-70 factor (ECF subfamily)